MKKTGGGLLEEGWQFSYFFRGVGGGVASRFSVNRYGQWKWRTRGEGAAYTSEYGMCAIDLLVLLESWTEASNCSKPTEVLSPAIYKVILYRNRSSKSLL